MKKVKTPAPRKHPVRRLASRMVTARVPNDLADLLETASVEHGLSKAEIMTDGLRRWLRAHKYSVGK